MSVQKDNGNLIDLHCHCLPGIDDGCRTVRESLELLRQSRESGIRAVFATPHYYRQESVPRFLFKRQMAFERIEEALDSKDFPKVLLGAEVAYFSGITDEPELSGLCLGKSDYLLLELPFSPWTPQLFRDLNVLSSVCGKQVILAHLERYEKIQDRKALERLYEMDVLIQMNAGELLRFGSRPQALKRLSKGRVDLLGSDAHNLTSRVQNLSAGYDVIRAKNPEVLPHLISNARNVLENAL